MVAHVTAPSNRCNFSLFVRGVLVSSDSTKSLINMATGNMLLGLSRKKLGDIVFYRSDGQQRARVRVRTIKNPRSAKQAVQRMVLAAASKTLAALRGLYNHSFENVAVGTPSMRYAQRLLMDGYRAKAAVIINGGEIEGNQAIFALKGAPIAGCYSGMPLTRGRLSLKEVTAVRETVGGQNVEGLQIAGLGNAFVATITSQEQYAAALAELGIEPGDQLTFVCYAGNASVIVAEFGSETNIADAYRYARVTFKTELPDGFSGTLIDSGAINAALIEKKEGVLPAITYADNAIFVNFSGALPAGYNFIAGTIVRSQKNAAGVTYYNNASFVTIEDAWDENNAAAVYPSYMDNADAVNVGDTLYLKNAEVAPFVKAGSDSVTVSTVPALPAVAPTITLSRAATDEEIEQHLKITIGGNVMVLSTNNRAFSFTIEGESFTWSSDDGKVWTTTGGGPEIESIVWA